MNSPTGITRKKRSLQGVTVLSHQRAAAPRAATLVYNALLDDIVSLRRKPMELLNEKELEAQFGVSRTPIREAIIRLADDGLVDVFPQSGTFVSRIPRRALYEAMLVRKALEDTTVSIAVEKMTPAGLRALERNLLISMPVTVKVMSQPSISSTMISTSSSALSPAFPASGQSSSRSRFTAIVTAC